MKTNTKKLALIESLESRQLFHAEFSAAVNFQPADAPRAPRMAIDYGSVFDARRGGYSYGWNVDTTDRAVDRNLSSLQRNDTFIVMQTPQANSARTWEIAVPESGQYRVYILAGDQATPNERMAISAEGEVVIAGITRKSRPFLDGTATVEVTDGRLTISSSNPGQSNKINYVVVEATHDEVGGEASPQVRVSTITNRAQENGTANGVFRLQRSGDDKSKTLRVPLIVEGSATNGTDYGRISSSYTFAVGQTSVDIVVRAANDSLTEGDETVVLKVGAVTGYSVSNLSTSDPVVIVDQQAPSTSSNIAWQSRANAPIAKSEIFGTSVGGKVYTFGGYQDFSFKPVKSAHVYDPATNTWSAIASLDVGNTHVAHAEDTRYIYFAGGYPGTGSNGNQVFATTKVFRYDTQTNTYSNLPSLPSARGGGAMTKLGNVLYFAGGNDIARVDRTNTWSLDLNNLGAGWVTRAALPAARNHPAMVSLNGFVYFIGGQQLQDAAAIYSRDVYRYNPGTNAWQTVASLPSARSHITSSTFISGGRIITLGGETTGRTVISSVNAYNPLTNTWSAMTNLPTSRFSGVGVGVSGNTFVYTSGYNGSFKNNTYRGIVG